MTGAFPVHDIGVMCAAMKAGRRRAVRTLKAWARLAPPEYRQALERGLPATAGVLDLETTGWRSGRNMDLTLRVSPRRHEYAIRLRVCRPGLADYEAEATAFLASGDVPLKGTVIPVRVHPERPEVVVLVPPPLDAPS